MVIGRKYRVFDYTWHIPHQYDLVSALKDDCDFYFCLNIKKQWDTSIRPLPDNLNFVCDYQPGYYDVAILHIDQQVIVENHPKRMIYDQFNALINDIPKIVINHGSPVFPERFLELGQTGLSAKQMEMHCVEMIKKIVGANTMVVNSMAAAKQQEWGFGIPIPHGINGSDWSALPKEPRVFTALSPHGFDSYYNRACINAIAEILENDYGYLLSYAKINVQTDASVEVYRDYLGRSLLYLDTSYRTPMNRARTEAFLSGCCVVQVNGAHDLELWAKNGENIVIVPNEPKTIAAIIADLLENRYAEALKIGHNGQKMALHEFSYERYRGKWLKLLKSLVD